MITPGKNSRPARTTAEMREELRKIELGIEPNCSKPCPGPQEQPPTGRDGTGLREEPRLAELGIEPDSSPWEPDVSPWEPDSSDNPREAA